MACFKKYRIAGRVTIGAQWNHTKTFEREWGAKEWSFEGVRKKIGKV